MNIRKLWIFIQILFNKKARNSIWRIHKRMGSDDSYSADRASRSLWSFLCHERIIRFSNVYVVNSFFPPFPGKAFEQIFNGTSHMDKELFKNYKIGKKVAPLSCYIAATNSCPYHCWHCSAADRKLNDNMSTGALKSLIRDLQDMGTAIIGFTGGEPLLRNDLVEIISSIDDRSVSLVFSSGYDLTNKKAQELKKAGLFGFAVSIDHYDPDEHDKIRGYKGAFDKAIEAVKASLGAGLFTIIQTVATKGLLNTGGIWKIIDLGKSLGVHEIRIMEPIKSGKLIGEKGVFLNDDERKQLISIHKKGNKIRGYPIITTFAHFESPDQFGCGAGVHHSYIDASGNLYPCDFVPMSFGNIKEESIKSLWSKMNKAMGGRPKLNCFMQQYSNRIKEVSDGSFPLSPEVSQKICKNCIADKGRLPKFFEIMN
ncbi:radical SAM protein [Patescibacteria group bacterium]|nr:radical SAM protein [Patescibacteria group bacterium]MBU4022879.1 radical SAM protein [Patescibacteria group bacterium]MBU4078111.1 radical SAM protein [Patescibacteria group bacterium]